MKTKKSIKVKSYTYRMKSDRFYVFVRKDDIEVIMNFFNKELKEFLRDKEVKPYSVDVFPEEAKRIVPKIKKMMSIENFSKLKNFGYPCQFGLILVGPPGLGKTVFVKYLRDVLHEAELEYDEDMFSNIISYGIGDIHNLIGRNDDLPHRGLILLDDLDGAITERSSNDGVEGRHVLPWLLTQLDRFSDSQCNLHRLIVLCCNQLSYTDKALIRPGRFDRIIKFKELDNGVIRNMVDFVMKHDSDVNEKTKEEIIELFENQNPRISLANISLMGRLYYGGLVDSWIDAAIWSINRGDSEDKELILKSKNNKVGF
jgi:SpoVK/Ycf46/Vps4 family AAA+-type ATPase